MFMSVVIMPRRSHADDLAQEILGRVTRWLLIGLGVAVIAGGVVISPLPGPGGIPVIVIGLMLVLRNSFWARKQFIRMQRRHPRVVFPLRRLLRREPEVFPVAWQQVLRMERLVLRKQWRVARKIRRALMRRRR